MENNLSAILEGLNSEQKKAVECTEGPVLIIAGAGSGKTRVITDRIAYILSGGVEPDNILALTFTKKAATEMKNRIAALVGERKARRLYMGTFHSIFVRFLREFADRIGYPSSFTIYDQSDAQSAVKACIRQLGLKDDEEYKPKRILSRISWAKNNLVTFSSYLNKPEIQDDDRRAKIPQTGNIYKAYTEYCRKQGVMDFDDILMNMAWLLTSDKQALMSISDRFKYIMVDEFQDTNLAQSYILDKMSLFHKNICVVGDDSQSIYAFRGARIENILNFSKKYPDRKLFRLEQNYRSTKTIVNAANSVISRNESRIPKTCFAVGDQGEKIEILKCYTEQEEALRIASAIVDRMQSDHAQYQDFAILYRTNAQSRALEEQLRKRNLPYVIYSGNSFFERAEVKDMMAYLKLSVNPNDDESFKRVVNTPARGIGDTSLKALEVAAQTLKCSLFKASYADNLEEYGLKPAASARIRSFSDMIRKAYDASGNTDAQALAGQLSSESGLYLFYKSDNTVESQSKAENIQELLNSVASFKEERFSDYREQMIEEGTIQEDTPLEEKDLPPVLMGEFLEDISLLSSVDVDDDKTNNRIALMTVHSAKGLEFPYVFITGMEDNLFPSGGLFASPDDIEEERRLFYVALTRAKKDVTLSYAASRIRNGKRQDDVPSRFIKEIDRQYIENPLTDDDFISEAHSFGSSFGSGFLGGMPKFHDRDNRPKKAPSEAVPQYQPPVDRKIVSSRTGVALSAQQLRNVSGLNRVLPPKIEDFVPSPVGQLKVGQRVEHNRFGDGEILEITGQYPDLKAKIRFDVYGEKLLLLKYAKIRIKSLGK